MRKKPLANKDLDEDQILWQRLAQRVTPLPGRQQRPSPLPLIKKGAKVTKPALKTSQNMRALPPSSKSIARPSSPIDLRKGERAGLDGRTQRRLFRGDVLIDRRLDLHGHTTAQAEVKLETFIEDAYYIGCRCVLVISGKGTGVLKNHVPRWLKRAPLSALVLALAEARPEDGGSGAFYVLLRRRRQ